MVGRILQGLFGGALIVIGLIGIIPMLWEQQQEFTMFGVLTLGMSLVGLDIVGRAMRK